MIKEANNVLQNEPELQECEQPQPSANETENNTEVQKFTGAKNLLSSIAYYQEKRAPNYYLGLITSSRKSALPFEPTLTPQKRHVLKYGKWASSGYKEESNTCGHCGDEFKPRTYIKNGILTAQETYIEFTRRKSCSASCAAFLREVSHGTSWHSELYKTAKNTCKGCGKQYKPLSRIDENGKTVAQMTKVQWDKREYCSRSCNNDSNPDRGNGSDNKYSIYKVVVSLESKINPILEPEIRRAYKTEEFDVPYSTLRVIVPLVIESLGVAIYFYRDKARPNSIKKLVKRAKVINEFLHLEPIYINTKKYLDSSLYRKKKIDISELPKLSSLNEL